MVVMRRFAAVWMFTVVALPVAAFGEANADDPSNVSVCDIARQPERFNGKLVTVRSRIDIAFEEFQLSGRACESPKIDGVWLEYGKGRKRQPTTWCCGDMVPRDGLSVLQNADFRTFHRYLTTQSRRSGCYEGQCYLYSVTATITGRVDAAPLETCPNGKGLCCIGGFGHLGVSCARLVIQRVSGVVAERRPR
jgi:hypothetical protein